jgi:hypothetical protein
MFKKTMEELREELSVDPVALAFIEAGPTFTFQIEKDNLEKGRSFSDGGVATITGHIGAYMQAQIYKKWALTGEPPSAMQIEVKVDIH